jgi:hypothetical protein
VGTDKNAKLTLIRPSAKLACMIRSRSTVVRELPDSQRNAAYDVMDF